MVDCVNSGGGHECHSGITGQDGQPSEEPGDQSPAVSPPTGAGSIPDFTEGPDSHDRRERDEALSKNESGVNCVHGQDCEGSHGQQPRSGTEPPPGKTVKSRQGQKVDYEATSLCNPHRHRERFPGVDPGQSEGKCPDVGVEWSGPVIQHSSTLENSRVFGEEALDIMLDRSLAPEDRSGHLEVVAAIAGNQRKIAPADPRDGPDHVADPEDCHPESSMPA